MYLRALVELCYAVAATRLHPLELEQIHKALNLHHIRVGKSIALHSWLSMCCENRQRVHYTLALPDKHPFAHVTYTESRHTKRPFKLFLQLAGRSNLNVLSYSPTCHHFPRRSRCNGTRVYGCHLARHCVALGLIAVRSSHQWENTRPPLPASKGSYTLP